MRDVVQSDLGAYLAVFFLMAFWTIVIIVAIANRYRDLAAQASYAPVYILVVGTTVLVALLIRLRTFQINLVLAGGKRVTATLNHYAAYHIYAQAWLTYKTGGEKADARLWLAASRMNRRLADMEEVELFLPPSANLPPVIGTLYGPAETPSAPTG